MAELFISGRLRFTRNERELMLVWETCRKCNPLESMRHERFLCYQHEHIKMYTLIPKRLNSKKRINIKCGRFYFYFQFTQHIQNIKINKTNPVKCNNKTSDIKLVHTNKP